MLSKIRVLLLDADPTIHTLFRLMFNATADLELLGATADIARLPRLCIEFSPHILVIGEEKKTLISEILLILDEHTPLTKTVILLASDMHCLRDLLDLPIHGSCTKAEIDESLVHILRAVAGGATSFSRQAIKNPFAANIDQAIAELDVQLTPRERRVLALLARGLDNDAIATTLNLRNQSVRNYVRTIYSKLQTHNRPEIVAKILGKSLPEPKR